MQLFRNEVFSAPTSFFVLAFLRQAVRFACLAASADAAEEAAEEALDGVETRVGEAAADVAAAGAAGDGGAAGVSPKLLAIAHRLRDRAAPRAAKLANR